LNERHYIHHIPITSIVDDLENNGFAKWRKRFSILLIFVAVVLIISIFFVSNRLWNRLGVFATIVMTLALLYLNAENIDIIRKQAKDNNRLVNAQTRPFVYVSLKKADNPPWLIELCIKNIGLAIAKDIKIETRDGFITDTGPLTDYPLLQNGKPYLAPTEKIEFVLIDFSKRDYTEFQNITFTIKVKYKSEENEEYKNEYPLTLSEFNLMRYAPKSGVYEGNRTTQTATMDLNKPINTDDEDKISDFKLAPFKIDNNKDKQ
jgi:hypothetical protein